LGYEVINLGGGCSPVSLQTLIAHIERALGKTAHYKAFHKLHPTDIGQSQADITKARQLLDWRVRVNLGDGLKHTIDWYRENRHWVNNLLQ
jgi:nucleoside-diphosphate-sugar epimerase